MSIPTFDTGVGWLAYLNALREQIGGGAGALPDPLLTETEEEMKYDEMVAAAEQKNLQAKTEAQQQILSTTTTAGGSNGATLQRQFVLSKKSKKGGYIIQYVSAHWTQPDNQKIYWEAFRVMPGEKSPKATYREGGSDQFSGGFDSKITADAQFYEGLTPKQLNSLFRDTGGKQVQESGSAPSTDRDPHVPMPAASNIVHVNWNNLAN